MLLARWAIVFLEKCNFPLVFDAGEWIPQLSVGPNISACAMPVFNFCDPSCIRLGAMAAEILPYCSKASFLFEVLLAVAVTQQPRIVMFCKDRYLNLINPP